MKSLIQKLLDRRNAYLAIGTEGKEILFDVTTMPDYGALSGRKLEDQMAGARIAVDAHKKNPGDFVLWKESGAKEPGWNGEFEFVPDPNNGYDAEFTVSPENAAELGLNSQVVAVHGRPGWHIECSAMSAAYLGNVFDIHGGGLDLVFPHHENEIAQSRCAHGTHAMANYWMHNGFLQVEGEKMSKSLGNFITIRELLKRAAGSVIRLNMLKTHYRQPIDWTDLALQHTRQELLNWSEFVAALPNWAAPNGAVDASLLEALCDDLNTPAAITRLRELFKLAQEDPKEHLSKFCASARFLGINDLEKSGHFRIAIGYWVPKEREDVAANVHTLAIFARTATANNLPEASSLLHEIERLGAKYEFTQDGDIRLSFSEKTFEQIVEEKVDARTAARKAKDFKESDRIRDELAAMGVVLKDSKDGTTWEIAR